MASNRQPKNWPATQAFEADAATTQKILAAAAKTVRDLCAEDTSHLGLRTEKDVAAMNAVLGHAQLLCEAMAALDGGKLARQML
jgi:hypothetical protein